MKLLVSYKTALYLIAADEDLQPKNKNTFGVEYTQVNYNDSCL